MKGAAIMYRKLEPKRAIPKMEATQIRATAQSQCVCTCKKTAEKNQEKAPAGEQARVFLGVEYDISG